MGLTEHGPARRRDGHAPFPPTIVLPVPAGVKLTFHDSGTAQHD
jgi:hypothetical protein